MTDDAAWAFGFLSFTSSFSFAAKNSGENARAETTTKTDNEDGNQ